MQKESLHTIPSNMKKVFESNLKIYEIWNTLTPLAQNEFICWVISAKKQETRDSRVKRMEEDLVKGKRRPCCWAGCPHRKYKKIF